MLFNYYSVMKANIKKEEPSCAQMTIFYDGKVIVFDDVPADKAKDIMDFSTKGIASTSQNHNNNYAYSSFLSRNSLQDYPQVPSIPVIYDLPMTRKASLHRFLEKRKDRIAAKAPYQTSNPAAFLNKPIDESMSWLSLAPQSECSSTSVLFL
ncbi:jasmonate zim-domain protein [Medicago truncatula]|uniref:Protein TIFY n=1 Tax=Medicago truncatula TaxID=3880 RepID=G7JYM0_MEDTR|nr:jasmonate zim-domain protein [Medicago truncatula]